MRDKRNHSKDLFSLTSGSGIYLNSLILQSPDYYTNILCSGCFTSALALRRSVVLLLVLYETTIKTKQQQQNIQQTTTNNKNTWEV